MKIELKIKGWNQVSINTYDRIMEVLNSEADEMEKDIEILAILCGVSYDDIASLKLGEIKELSENTGWLSDFKFDKDIKFKTIKLNDWELVVDTNIQNFSVAQYIDFQNYFKDLDRKKAEIMSTILIPKGKKYCDGYDVTDLITDIKDNLDICTYNSVCFFFLKKLVRSINRTLTYLEVMMKMKSLTVRKKIAKIATAQTARMIQEVKDIILGDGLH